MQQEDYLLVQQLKAGDASALSEVIVTHRSKALSTALRMVKDAMVAEEIVQDSFAKAYRNIHQFDGRSRFSTWFFRIVYTTSLNYLQKHRQLPLIEVFSEDDSAEYTEPSIFESLRKEEIESAVRHQLQQMSALYAVVLDLFYVQELSYEEIMEITGMPLGTVKTRLNRGRGILKRALMSKHAELVEDVVNTTIMTGEI